MTQQSVVGRCIINPYLDNKNEIYKQTSREIGNFQDADGDQIRKECYKLRTHKSPQKQQTFDPFQDQLQVNSMKIKERDTHQIFNYENCRSEFESTSRIAETQMLLESENYKPEAAKSHREKEFERVQEKMELLYGQK